jgi:hypothetical protein
MIAGAGYGGAAIGMSLLLRFILAGIAAYETRSFEKYPAILATLGYDPAEGRTRVRLERLFADYPAACILAEWRPTDSGPDQVTLRIQLPRHHLRELLDDLVSIAEVKSVRERPAAE